MPSYIRICSSQWKERRPQSGKTRWRLWVKYKDVSLEAHGNMKNNAAFLIRFWDLSRSNKVSHVPSRRWGLGLQRHLKPMAYQNKKNKCGLGLFLGRSRASSHLGWKFHMALTSSRANPFGIVKGICQQSISKYLSSILDRNWLSCLKHVWNTLRPHQKGFQKEICKETGRCKSSLNSALPPKPTEVYFSPKNFNYSYYHKTELHPFKPLVQTWTKMPFLGSLNKT